jgi:predicted PurR-regulated permease PerM
MTREHLFAGFFFAVFVYLLYQTFRIFAPFLVPIVWGVVLALTLFPLHTGLTDALRGRPTLSAGILSLAVVVLVAVPAVLFGSVLIAQGAALYQKASLVIEQGGFDAVVQWLAASPLGGVWQRVMPHLTQYEIDVARLTRNTLAAAWNLIADHAGHVARNLILILFDSLVSLLTLFVCLRGGTGFIAQLQDIVPMEREHSDAILRTLLDTVSGIVQAMLATALAQGLLAGIGYWLAGVPFSLFLGVLSGFLSLIPYAVPVVWLGCAGYLFSIGSTGAAIFLIIWGIAVIGSVDNVIRPLVIGGRANLSPFLLFFAILGGLSAYGFLGLLLGPVVVATVVTFVRIYREEYGTQTSQVADAPEGS